MICLAKQLRLVEDKQRIHFPFGTIHYLRANISPDKHQNKLISSFYQWNSSCNDQRLFRNRIVRVTNVALGNYQVFSSQQLNCLYSAQNSKNTERSSGIDASNCHVLSNVIFSEVSFFYHVFRLFLERFRSNFGVMSKNEY